MPAVIEMRDTRAYHAASKIWGYCRQNSRSLDGERHAKYVQDAIEKAMKKEVELAKRIEKENEALKWLLSIATRAASETTMKKRQQGKLDAEIKHGYEKHNCSLMQLASVFRCSQDTIRGILKLSAKAGEQS